MISSELPEVLRLSHRIMVMAGGRITGEIDSDGADQATIMDYATRVEAAGSGKMSEVKSVPRTEASTGALKHESPRVLPAPAAATVAGFRNPDRPAGLLLLGQPQIFFTYTNISGILLSTAVIGILAFGTTLVIITGGIDLSIGTGMTLCSVVTATAAGELPVAAVHWRARRHRDGRLMGLINGLNVSILKLPAVHRHTGHDADCAGSRPGCFPACGRSTSVRSRVSRTLPPGQLIPGLPNAVLILVLTGIAALSVC